MATVAILVFSEIRKDPRVLRHIAALREQHQVVSCARGPAPDGVSEHFQIPDAAVVLPKTPGVIASLAAHRFERAYAGSQAARQVRRLLADAPFDLLLANDALTLPIAFEVAGKRPVIADLHEFAPRQVESSTRFRLMVAPLMDYICRSYLPRAAGITTVGDGIKEEYTRVYGVRVRTVTNASPNRSPRPRPVSEVVRLVHSGAALPNRQLELMIRAAGEVPGVSLDLLLVTFPWHLDYLDSLRGLAEASRNVRILDPVPLEDLPVALDQYDAGVFVLPPNSFNSLHTLPNKFFDFVQSGLGIIIGPSPEMARLVHRHQLGLVLTDFREDTLREVLTELDPTQVGRWKAASCAAAAELSSQSQAEALRSMVDAALTGQPPG